MARASKDTLGKAMLDVTIVLLEQGYASTAIGPLEVFHSAGVLWNWLHGNTPQPRFRVRIASIDGRSVTTLCSLGLTPQCSISEVEHTDIIVLPASGWDIQDRIANTALLPWLREWHSRGAYIAGICSGVSFLAECGLLDGREATTHWGVSEIYRERYPNVHWRPEQFVTEDGRILCSGGVYASMDLSLYLVEKFCGHTIALQCAKSLLVSMPRTSQSGYSMVPLCRPHSDEKIRRIEAYLTKNFERALTIRTLAASTGMSSRNFVRRFKAATGRLPGAYIQALRVLEAKALLEDGAVSIQTAALKIGYKDLASFRRLFKRQTGMTPAAYREHFGSMSLARGELLQNNLRSAA
jgi:transcriptional regulator GlxA family with amidase domain